MAIVHVTSENYEKEVLQSDKPVLIDFWASWCGPCQMLGPVIEEVSEEVTDVKFVKVSTEEAPELAEKFFYYVHSDTGTHGKWNGCK